MSTEPEVKADAKNVVKLKKTYEAFDETLHLIKVEDVPVEYTEVATMEEAVQYLASNQDLYIDAANSAIRRKALSDAKRNAGISGGINRAVVMEFLKPYREDPQFSSMIKDPDKRKATAPEWDAQTNAILDELRKIPFVVKSIKERSAMIKDED